MLLPLIRLVAAKKKLLFMTVDKENLIIMHHFNELSAPHFLVSDLALLGTLETAMNEFGLRRKSQMKSRRISARHPSHYSWNR